MDRIRTNRVSEHYHEDLDFSDSIRQAKNTTTGDADGFQRCPRCYAIIMFWEEYGNMEGKKTVYWTIQLSQGQEMYNGYPNKALLIRKPLHQQCHTCKAPFLQDQRCPHHDNKLLSVQEVYPNKGRALRMTWKEFNHYLELSQYIHDTQYCSLSRGI